MIHSDRLTGVRRRRKQSLPEVWSRPGDRLREAALAELCESIHRLPIGDLLNLLENRAVQDTVIVSPVTWHAIPPTLLTDIREELVMRIHSAGGRWKATPTSRVEVVSDGKEFHVELC